MFINNVEISVINLSPQLKKKKFSLKSKIISKLMHTNKTPLKF